MWVIHVDMNFSKWRRDNIENIKMVIPRRTGHFIALRRLSLSSELARPLTC